MYRVFQIAVRNGGEGVRNFTGVEFFYQVKGTWRGVVLKFQTFFKAKIKINMTKVSKEYKLKTKIEQEQWLKLKMLLLLGYNLKIVI